MGQRHRNLSRERPLSDWKKKIWPTLLKRDISLGADLTLSTLPFYFFSSPPSDSPIESVLYSPSPPYVAPISQSRRGTYADISRNVILLKHMSAWLIGRSTARINNSAKNDVPRFRVLASPHASPQFVVSPLRSPLTCLWELGKKSHMGAACATKRGGGSCW